MHTRYVVSWYDYQTDMLIADYSDSVKFIFSTTAQSQQSLQVASSVDYQI